MLPEEELPCPELLLVSGVLELLLLSGVVELLLPLEVPPGVHWEPPVAEPGVNPK